MVKNPPANAGDSGQISESGRSPGEGNGKLLQCSCLGNAMDRGAWWATYSPWGCKELDRGSDLCPVRLYRIASIFLPVVAPPPLWLSILAPTALPSECGL